MIASHRAWNSSWSSTVRPLTAALSVAAVPLDILAFVGGVIVAPEPSPSLRSLHYLLSTTSLEIFNFSLPNSV